MMIIEANKTYQLTPSGDPVRVIAPTTRHRGNPMWEVEPVSGSSRGMRLEVPERALAPLSQTK